MLELRALSPIDIRAEQPDIAREGDAGVRIAELLFTQAGSGTELRRGQAECRRGLQVAQHQRRQHARLAAGPAGQPPAPAVSRAPESASARDVRLGDTAVVTGRVQAKVKMGETPIVEDVRFTRVYQRRGERWRMVAGQGTRLAPPAEQH